MPSVPACDTSMVYEVPLLSAAPGGWEDLEGSHAVTRLCFLEGRKSAATAGRVRLGHYRLHPCPLFIALYEMLLPTLSGISSDADCAAF